MKWGKKGSNSHTSRDPIIVVRTKTTSQMANNCSRLFSAYEMSRFYRFGYLIKYCICIRVIIVTNLACDYKEIINYTHVSELRR